MSAISGHANLEFKFDSMEKYFKAVNDKVSNLQVKVERFEEFGKETILERLNFGEYFVQWIKTFYNDISSCVLNNRFTTDLFPVRRGKDRGIPYHNYYLYWLLKCLFAKFEMIKLLKV